MAMRTITLWRLLTNSQDESEAMTQEEREVAIKYSEFAKVLAECSRIIAAGETGDDLFMRGLQVAASNGLMSLAKITLDAMKRFGFKSS